MFSVIDHDNTNVKPAESRAKAEDKKATAEQFGSMNVEIVKGDFEDYHDYRTDHDDPSTDGGVDPDVIDHSPAADADVDPTPEPEPEPPQTETAEAIDRLGESLEDDPLAILPGHMVDEIQGVPAINKRGYSMIAERYGIEVTTEILAFPWDNDAGRAVAKATARTEDGKTYTGHATASKGDGDMPEQLIELADTRAMKRAVSWASGLGIVAYEELTDEL